MPVSIIKATRSHGSKNDDTTQTSEKMPADHFSLLGYFNAYEAGQFVSKGVFGDNKLDYGPSLLFPSTFVSVAPSLYLYAHGLLLPFPSLRLCASASLPATQYNI